MNEKILKLIKLANNNPNENEANLAARKVCRMLEEEYKFGSGPKLNFKSNQGWGSNPSGGAQKEYDDFMHIYDEMKKNQEQDYKNRKSQEYQRSRTGYYYTHNPYKDRVKPQTEFKSCPLCGNPLMSPTLTDNRIYCTQCKYSI